MHFPFGPLALESRGLEFAVALGEHLRLPAFQPVARRDVSERAVQTLVVVNVHVLREFRRNCKTLIALGACAVNGGLPAQRNHLPLSECLREVYQFRPGVENGQIPNDPELPLPLDKVRPIHEVVRIDYFIPGCPPSGPAIWKFLTDLIAGRTPRLTDGLLHYD